MPGTYDTRQKAFALAIFSNRASCVEGDRAGNEKSLYFVLEGDDGNNKKGLLEDYRGQLGPWKIVWGPGIYQPKDSPYPANTMFIAKQEGDVGSVPEYVISVAGTNPHSTFSWTHENFNVHKLVPWTYGRVSPITEKVKNADNTEVTEVAKIAEGTQEGLQILLGIKPAADSVPGKGLTIGDFLKQELTNKPAASVTVAGHSLGGSLAPTLALWLHDQKKQWMPTGCRVSITTYASAGRTAGNAAFAKYSDSQIGETTHRIHNSMDLVPHFWQINQAEEVPRLYEPSIVAPLVIDLFIKLLLDYTWGDNYTQIKEQAKALSGQVNTSSDVYKPLRHPKIRRVANLENYVRQMKWQHINGYYELLKTPELKPVLKCLDEHPESVDSSQGNQALMRHLLLARRRFRRSG